ncbi:hypothetical protein FF1_012567 [Malus domestica]
MYPFSCIQDGPLTYLNVTLFENCSPKKLRDLYMDNDYLSHLPSLFLRQIWYLFWKHKMLKMSTREQCQVKTRPKEKTGKKHDMGYSCF